MPLNPPWIYGAESAGLDVGETIGGATPNTLLQIAGNGELLSGVPVDAVPNGQNISETYNGLLWNGEAWQEAKLAQVDANGNPALTGVGNNVLLGTNGAGLLEGGPSTAEVTNAINAKTWANAPSGDDDSAYLAGLLAATGTVEFGPFTYLIKTPNVVTWDPSKTRVIGNNTVFDCSTLTSGTAVTIDGTQNPYSNTTRPWEGIDLKGPTTPLITTVAAGSNGVNVNTFGGGGVLNVASTAGYPAAGTLAVRVGNGLGLINYTGVTATTFTGCTSVGGDGALTTGDAVADATVTGLSLQGASAGGSSIFNLRDIVIRDFSIGVKIGSNAWCMNFEGCAIHDNSVHILEPPSNTNSGERITFIGCTLFNGGIAIARGDYAGTNSLTSDFYFTNCSFDFNQQLLIAGKQSQTDFDGCHIEYNTNPLPPIQMTAGSPPLVTVRSGQWYAHGSMTLTAALTSGVPTTVLDVTTSAAIAQGDLVTVFTPAASGYVSDTFTASAPVAEGSTAIPVTSQAPANDYAANAAYVVDISRLPANIVSADVSTITSIPIRFENIQLNGAITSTGNFTNGAAVTAKNCFINSSNAYNLQPGTGATTTMPPTDGPNSSFNGPISQNANYGTTYATNTLTLDPTLTACAYRGISSTAAQTIAFANTPAASVVQDLTIGIYNSAGAALGAITWPSTVDWGSLTWTNPAPGKASFVTFRWIGPLGKWVAVNTVTTD